MDICKFSFSDSYKSKSMIATECLPTPLSLPCIIFSGTYVCQSVQPADYVSPSPLCCTRSGEDAWRHSTCNYCVIIVRDSVVMDYSMLDCQSLV